MLDVKDFIKKSAMKAFDDTMSGYYTYGYDMNTAKLIYEDELLHIKIKESEEECHHDFYTMSREDFDKKWF